MSANPDTAARIVSAASALIAERGYNATTTREIAKRAGVNEVTVFRHFQSKAGILKAIAARFAEASATSAITRIADPEDARATLLALARNEIAESMANGGVALRLAFDASTVPEIAELMGEGPASNLKTLADYLADRQRAGQVRGDIAPEVLAEAFATLSSSYVMFRAVMGVLETPADVADDDTVAQLFEVFWSGIRADKRDNEGV